MKRKHDPKCAAYRYAISSMVYKVSVGEKTPAQKQVKAYVRSLRNATHVYICPSCRKTA